MYVQEGVFARQGSFFCGRGFSCGGECMYVCVCQRSSCFPTSCTLADTPNQSDAQNAVKPQGIMFCDMTACLTDALMSSIEL